MSDILVTVSESQPINVQLSDTDISVEVSQSQPINVTVENSQPINVDITNKQPINVTLADSIVINNLFIQDEQPITNQPTYVWIETDAGNIKTFWVETGV